MLLAYILTCLICRLTEARARALLTDNWSGICLENCKGGHRIEAEKNKAAGRVRGPVETSPLLCAKNPVVFPDSFERPLP
jgi:hypothetical protein